MTAKKVTVAKPEVVKVAKKIEKPVCTKIVKASYLDAGGTKQALAVACLAACNSNTTQAAKLFRLCAGTVRKATKAGNIAKECREAINYVKYASKTDNIAKAKGLAHYPQAENAAKEQLAKV